MRRKFTSNDDGSTPITFMGVEYFFIACDEGVGVRRKDGKAPAESDVESLTEYLFNEGWVNREDYEEIDNEF